MILTTLQTVYLPDGRKCKILEFLPENKVRVGWYPGEEKGWEAVVTQEEIIIKQDSSIL